MNRRYQNTLWYLLLLFIVGDLGYSFWQYLYFPIDEDLARIVVPDHYYATVLEDPLGVRVWQEDTRYQATNRFAAHYTIWAYFRVVPQALQSLLSPIDSLYWSAAIFKLLVQLLLLSQLSRYALSIFRAGRLHKLAGLAFFLPFFQTMGYQHIFGIIDTSITYTFFYAWPMALLLVLYWPFYRRWMHLPNRRISTGRAILSVFLAFILPFSSPLAAPVLLLIAGLYFIEQVRFLAIYGFRLKAWAEILARERFTLFFFVASSLWAVYAFVLGLYNTENIVPEAISLGARYQLMFSGLAHHFTAKLAYPLLTTLLVANAILLWRKPKHYSWYIWTKALPFLATGILLYLALLPLGGYRPYRPEIVRRDTLVPILLVLLLVLSWSSFTLAQVLRGRQRQAYLIVLIAVLAIFTLADGPNAQLNACERQGLEALAEATESPYTLPVNCPVLAWEPYEEASHSQWNARFLWQLGITEQPILYKNPD